MSKPSVQIRAAETVLKSRSFYRLYILGLLFLYCTLFYYFGELVDWVGWTPLRFGIFYTVHDIHRFLFLAPIVYSAYFFGVRSSVIITALVGVVILPRALFFSPYPDPILRSGIFLLIAGALGYLVARVRSESRKCYVLESRVEHERDRLQETLERMEDGILIIGADYRIRFLNRSMVRDFGEGIGLPCREYLGRFSYPCDRVCKLPEVLKGQTARWQYAFPNGKTFEVVASPCTDSDGSVCQLAIFRDITGRRPAPAPPSTITGSAAERAVQDNH